MSFTKTHIIPLKDHASLVGRLNGLGLASLLVKSQYESFRLKGSQGSIIGYKSGKVVFQGDDSMADLFESITGIVSEVRVKKEENGNLFEEDFIPHIGSDETGKGDYFGPMVVACCYVSEANSSKLLDLGVKDSKKLTDAKVEEISDIMSELCPNYVRIIPPNEYNASISKTNNVAVTLARAHSEAIESLLGELQGKSLPCDLVVVDQFSSNKSRIENELGPLARKIRVSQFHKGESDIAVAAASILARARFVEAMDEMSEKYGMRFPKGANNVISAGKDFVREFGVERLGDVAKLSFKTTKQVIYGV